MSTTNPKETNDEKDKEREVQAKKDDPRIKTVTPDNENGEPGPPAEAENKSEGAKE